MKAYAYLAVAILSETCATTAMKAADGFRRPLPSVVVVLGYGISFYCLSVCVRSLPLGVTYAIWSGIGIVLVTLAGYFLYHQRIDTAAFVGMALIAAGVLVLNLVSKSVPH